MNSPTPMPSAMAIWCGLNRFGAGGVESSAWVSAWALMAASRYCLGVAAFISGRRHFQRSRQAERSRKIPVMKNSMAVRIGSSATSMSPKPSTAPNGAFQ